MSREIRHPYTSPHLRVPTDVADDHPRTKQAFKDECDINRIMRKFQKTGILEHTRRHAPQYGEASTMDLLTAQTIIKDAERMYQELPSSVRKKFSGPVDFLQFVENPENAEEIYKMGLAVRQTPAEPLLVRVQPEPEPEPANGET